MSRKPNLNFFIYKPAVWRYNSEPRMRPAKVRDLYSLIRRKTRMNESMSIRSRKRETDILLAVGIAKPAVILQYVLETLLIAVVAFPLAYLSSKQVAGALGTLFGKAAENVIVTPEHFMLVAIVGGVLLVAAVLVSSISTMRLKPKQILSQME